MNLVTPLGMGSLAFSVSAQLEQEGCYGGLVAWDFGPHHGADRVGDTLHTQ